MKSGAFVDGSLVRRWLSINQAVFVDGGLVRRPASINQAVFVDGRLEGGPVVMTEEDFVRFALSGPSHRILRGLIDHLSAAGPSPYTSPRVDTPPPVISTGQAITLCR